MSEMLVLIEELCRMKGPSGLVGGTSDEGWGSHHDLNLVEETREVAEERSLLWLAEEGSRECRLIRVVVGMLHSLVGSIQCTGWGVHDESRGAIACQLFFFLSKEAVLYLLG